MRPSLFLYLIFVSLAALAMASPVAHAKLTPPAEKIRPDYLSPRRCANPISLDLTEGETELADLRSGIVDGSEEIFDLVEASYFGEYADRKSGARDSILGSASLAFPPGSRPVATSQVLCHTGSVARPDFSIHGRITFPVAISARDGRFDYLRSDVFRARGALGGTEIGFPQESGYLESGNPVGGRLPAGVSAVVIPVRKANGDVEMRTRLAVEEPNYRAVHWSRATYRRRPR